jgi:hypothetical protein
MPTATSTTMITTAMIAIAWRVRTD